MVLLDGEIVTFIDKVVGGGGRAGWVGEDFGNDGVGNLYMQKSWEKEKAVFQKCDS